MHQAHIEKNSNSQISKKAPMYRSPRQIRRDNRLLFSRPRRSNVFALILGVLIGGVLVASTLFFDEMQLEALDAIGIAPTVTPFASQHATWGADFYAVGDIEEAAREFELAVNQQPENVSYLYEYGSILITLVDLDVLDDSGIAEASQIGDRIIELAPDDPRGYALKSRTMMWGDPASAITVALTGLEADAEFAPLHGVLAVAYANIGRFQEGLIRGELAVRLDPMNADVHRNYSIPLIYVGRATEAIEQLETAVSINPNLTAPYFELAAQYRAIDFPEMAVSIYWRILDIDPENERAYLRLCETYSSVGQFQEAQGYCETALDININYGSAYRELGRMQYNRRNYEGAIASFETCVGLGAEDIECYYLRGLAHYFLAQCDQAWNVLNQALNRVEEGSIRDNVLIGMENVTVNCPAYRGRQLPTPIPPTPIPPTPIGGF